MNELIPPGWAWDGSRWVCDCESDPCRPVPPGPPPWFPPPQGQPPWYPGANGGVSFGQNPPPNPIRGHFWFDGATLWMFDGATWEGVGGEQASGAGTVAVGANPPSNPSVGQLWFDGTAILVWTGSQWFSTGGGTSTGTSPPANPQPGQQWFNGSVLYVWDGNAWIPVSATRSYVQPTAPPSPNPGDTWWDGTQMRIWTGSAWALVGPGATTGPVSTTTHMFSLLLGAASLDVPSGYSIIPFTSAPAIDPQGMWQSTTQQIRPKIAGNYLVFITGWGVYGTGQNQIFMLKNDPGVVTSDSINTQMSIAEAGGNAAAAGIGLSASGMVNMNGTSDYLRLWSLLSQNTFYPFSPQVPVIDIWLFP